VVNDEFYRPAITPREVVHLRINLWRLQHRCRDKQRRPLTGIGFHFRRR
jgi:hypothetical protein